MIVSARARVHLLLGLALTSYLGRCDGIRMDMERVTTDENTTYPQITIAQGTLQGVDMVTRKNRSIYGFIGVPFAQPPIGDLRFEAPEPLEPWNGTLDAGNVNETIMCPQFDENDGSFTGDEDCLYLNVYTPHLLENLTQLMGDAPVVYPSYKSLQLQLPVAASPLYFSVFKYRGNFSKTYSVSGGSTEYVGAMHGDEILHLFPHHDSQFAPDGYEFTDTDWKMVDTMVQLWTSFAISGTPTTAESSVTWEPYSTLNNYLLIGNGTDAALKMQSDLFIERIQFWEELTAGTESGGIRIISHIFTMAAALYLLSSV